MTEKASQTGRSAIVQRLYYVRVTDPNGGKVLGTSGSSTPVAVSGGKFKQCYKLWDVLATGGKPGFVDTPNKGGVYKVWVSPDAGFAEAKTDNFKVGPAKGTPNTKKPLPEGTLLSIVKHCGNISGNIYSPTPVPSVEKLILLF